MRTDNIVQASRDIYYQNVYLFIDWIKNTVSVRESKIVRSNLNTYLWESVQEWYSFKLIQLKRDVLCDLEEDVEQWICVLEKRFKSFILICMMMLMMKQYSMMNTRNHCEPVSFVQLIVWHTRDVNFNIMRVQLIYVWNQLNVELQCDISEFSDETLLTNFIQSIKVKKQIWFKLIRQERMLNCVFNLEDQSQNQNVMKCTDNFNFSDFNQQLFWNDLLNLLKDKECIID